jgi:hypothetical protein
MSVTPLDKLSGQSITVGNLDHDRPSARDRACVAEFVASLETAIRKNAAAIRARTGAGEGWP